MSSFNIYNTPPASIHRKILQTPGSFDRIYFCPIQHIDWSAFPRGYFEANPATGKIDTHVIAPISGKVFFEALLPNSRRSYTEEPEQTDAGVLFKIKLSAIIPFPDDADLLNIAALLQYRFIVLVAFCNGTVKVLGNRNDGVKLFASEDRGESSRSIPGITIGFEWTTIHKPLLNIV